MTSLPEIVEVVIGVDTHVRTHSAAAVDARTGGVLGELTVAATPEGYQALVDFAGAHVRRGCSLTAWRCCASGDEKNTARGLGGLGGALLSIGDQTRARAVAEDSLAVARGFFNRWSTAMSLAPLGHVELADIDHIRAHALLTDAASLFAGTDNLIYPQWCLEGLARAAAARGDYERAAELDGARDALRSQTGVLLPPLHPAAYTRTLAVVRARLTTNGVRRGPRQAGRPDTAADHHGSLRRQELAAINISPLAIRARTGRSACRGTATTRLSPPRFVMRTSLRQGICQAARLKSRGLIRLRQYIALRRLLTRMVLSP